MAWSTDKIIAMGVLVAFFGAIIMGSDKDLQTFLAGGLLGYLQRHTEGKEGK